MSPQWEACNGVGNDEYSTWHNPFKDDQNRIYGCAEIVTLCHQIYLQSTRNRVRLLSEICPDIIISKMESVPVVTIGTLYASYQYTKGFNPIICHFCVMHHFLCLSVSLFVCLSVSLFVCLSVSLSAFLFHFCQTVCGMLIWNNIQPIAVGNMVYNE